MNCTTTVTHSLVKVEENRRKAVFRNPKSLNYHVSQVDNCLIKSGRRADFLVSEENGPSIIVELKGKNVAHACEQLFETATHPIMESLLQKPLGFLIVCSKFPRFDTAVLRAKSRAARDFKAGLHVVCDNGTFDINDLVSIARK